MKAILLPIAFALCLAPTLLTAASAEATAAKTVHRAIRTETAITVDGKLDEAVWKTAPAYSFNVAWRRDSPHVPLSDGGEVRLAWDDDYLYIGASLEDPDVVAEDDSDNAHHYRSGDVLEIFLRPPGKRWYWEIYGTPNSRRTVFFFPSRGRLFLPSSPNTTMDVKVAAKVEGTLNHWEDKDQRWTVEIAIPRSDLTARGEQLAPGTPPWQMLIARYNYSAYHEVQGGETSSTSPQTENSNFQNFDMWGELVLEKPQ